MRLQKIALSTQFNEQWIDAYTLLYSLFHSTAQQQISPPAAFLGGWHGYKAIIIPSVTFHENVTITSGWIGYYSYPDRLDEARLPAIMGAKIPEALVQDQTNQWWWLSNIDLQDEGKTTAFPDWILSLKTRTIPEFCHITWKSPSQSQHNHMVELCLAAIRRGDVYQVNLCTAFRGISDCSEIDIFCNIGARIRAHKSAFLTGPWGTIASFSPETFLTTSNRTITMTPIKGTLPIYCDQKILATSCKDRAENIMIVDVVRNDISKVIKLFSMRIPHLCEIIPAPGVWHLVSTVEGTLQSHISPQDIIAATFPIASITGAPKISACQLISAWEEHARGVYCGFAGIVLNNGDMDLSVLIRTLEIAPHGDIFLGVGGGVTIDSTPDNEFQELCAKAHAITENSN